MDKRSFSVLVTVVAVSMVILGTYKIARKKGQLSNMHTLAVTKTNK